MPPFLCHCLISWSDFDHISGVALIHSFLELLLVGIDIHSEHECVVVFCLLQSWPTWRWCGGQTCFSWEHSAEAIWADAGGITFWPPEHGWCAGVFSFFFFFNLWLPGLLSWLSEFLLSLWWCFWEGQGASFFTCNAILVKIGVEL